jgi:hypothetical protein
VLAFLLLLGLAISQWSSIKNVLEGHASELILAMGLLFPLTALNLYAEVRKWFSLLKTERMNVRMGYYQVLSGMCSGFVTPNRIGEFAGRMVYLPKEYHDIAAAAAISGSVIQGSITALFGIVGLAFFPVFPEGITSFDPLIIAGLVTCIMLILALSFRGIVRSLSKRFTATAHYFSTMGRPLILRAMTWALFRYLIFSTQFVIALYCFGFQGSLYEAFSGVFLLYFCQSYIPGPGMGELGIRELLALVLFTSFLPHPLLAVLAGLTVWLANIGLPVLAGVSIMGFSLRNGYR